MEGRKEAKLNMYHQVIELCDNNPAIVALVVAFGTSYNIFKTTVTAIMASAVDLEAPRGGPGAVKRTARKNLAVTGSGIAGMVSAYASVNDDEELEALMDITESDILRAKDEEVGPICQKIHDTANGLVASLADYGVTPALLTAFQNMIDDWADKSPKPQQSKAHIRALNQLTRQLFRDADKVLKKQMDKLVVNYVTNGNAEFEAQYQATRVIIEPGSFSTVLKILVLNNATNMPLPNVKVYRDGSPAIKRSTVKGLVTFKDIEVGPHTFVLKHKLFNNLTVSAMVDHGQKPLVTAKMVPVGDAGTPAGDPVGFSITEFPIPAGSFIVMPLVNPIPPGTEFYFRSIGGNAVICTSNLPASSCITGYMLNEGSPFQGEFSGLGLNMTLTHIVITNPGSEDIVVRAGTNG